jgi:hypothetical protein
MLPLPIIVAVPSNQNRVSAAFSDRRARHLVLTRGLIQDDIVAAGTQALKELLTTRVKAVAGVCLKMVKMFY